QTQGRILPPVGGSFACPRRSRAPCSSFAAVGPKTAVMERYSAALREFEMRSPKGSAAISGPQGRGSIPSRRTTLPNSNRIAWTYSRTHSAAVVLQFGDFDRGAPEPTASGCRRLPPSSGGGRPCGCWADYVRVQADPWQPLLLERLIAALELSMKHLEALMLSDEWDSIPRHRQRRLAEALEDVRVDTEQLNLALKLSP